MCRQSAFFQVSSLAAGNDLIRIKMQCTYRVRNRNFIKLLMSIYLSDPFFARNWIMRNTEEKIKEQNEKSNNSNENENSREKNTVQSNRRLTQFYSNVLTWRNWFPLFLFCNSLFCNFPLFHRHQHEVLKLKLNL